MAASRCPSLLALLLLGPGALPCADAEGGRTAYELLCDTRLGLRKWTEKECGMFRPTCQKLDIKCDGDSRVEEITIGWHQDTFGLGSLSNLMGARTGWPILDSVAETVGTFRTFKISKDAEPVESDKYVTRFFLQSIGCEDPKDECYISWPEYEPIRAEGHIVGVTRFYLAYHEEVAGHPEAHIEMGQWASNHSKSSFRLVGTGVEAPPPAPVFAGSTGTGCARGDVCDSPERHESPVPFKEFKVTTHHLMEHPQGSGLYQLKSDINHVVQQETAIHKFKEKH